MLYIRKLLVWKGITKNGEFCTGKIYEKNPDLARKKIKQQGILIKSMQWRVGLHFEQHIKKQAIYHLLKQLTRLLKSGLTLMQSLALLIIHAESSLKKCLQDIKLLLENGSLLSEALLRYPIYFNQFYVQLICLGEKTSDLENILEHITFQIEKNLTLVKKIKKALSYPMLVALIATMIIAVFLFSLMPQFEQMFIDMHAPLPYFSQLIIKISHISFMEFLSIIFFINFILLFLRIINKLKSFSTKWDQIILFLPIIGTFNTNLFYTRFSYALAIGLKAGLPLIDALPMLIELTKNTVYRHAILNACKAVMQGESFYYALGLQKVFSAEFLGFIQMGEQSSSLVDMLFTLAGLYEERINDFLDTLIILLEPVLISFLSLIIGAFIIGMYLPLFKLGNLV